MFKTKKKTYGEDDNSPDDYSDRLGLSTLNRSYTPPSEDVFREKQRIAREKLFGEVMEIVDSHPEESIILEIPTGTGKTFLSLHIIERDKSGYPWLVLSPEIAQCDSLALDMEKHSMNHLLGEGKIADIRCYAALPSILEKFSGKTVNIWFDEAAHISKLRKVLSKYMNIHKAIYSSAVIPSEVMDRIKSLTPNYTLIYKSMGEAIEESLMPPYEVHICIIKPSTRKDIVVKKRDGGTFNTSAKEHLIYMDKRLRKLMKDPSEKNKRIYYSICRNYTDLVSSQKTNALQRLYEEQKEEGIKTITFCGSIPQMEYIDASRAINSYKSKSTNREIIQDFNLNKENSLLTLKMAREGINLEGIECAILSDLSVLSKDSTGFIQECGRASRNHNPKIILLVLDTPRDMKYLTKAIKLLKGKMTKFVEKWKK